MPCVRLFRIKPSTRPTVRLRPHSKINVKGFLHRHYVLHRVFCFVDVAEMKDAFTAAGSKEQQCSILVFWLIANCYSYFMRLSL